MARVIAVKNWDRFQHYKDRDPPWIKLYRDALTSEVWVLGTDLSRLLQLASTLLSARYQNATPLDPKLIRRVLNLDCSDAELIAAIEHLAAHEFLEIQEVATPRKQLASNVLATCTSEGEKSREEQSREREERAREPTLASDAPRPEPTPAVRTCLLLREGGHTHGNAAHPGLIAALDAGVTPEDIRAVADEFPDKPLAYWLRTATGRKSDASRIRASPAAVAQQRWTPPDDDPEYTTRASA